MESPAADAPGASGPIRSRSLHIVTWDAPKLVAALRLGHADRPPVRVTSCATLQAIIEAALMDRPDVIILPSGWVAPQTERAIVRGFRARLPRTRVLLAVSPLRAAAGVDLTLFDGLVSRDEPELDLRLVLAPLLERTQRNTSRDQVLLPAELTLVSGATICAMAVNVSDGGAAFELPRGAVVDALTGVRFHRDDGRTISFPSAIVWHQPSACDGGRLGVRFVRASLLALRALRDLAFWRVEREPEGEVIHLCGVLTAATSFAALRLAVARTPRLDLAAVATATAPGLLRWYDFLLDLPPGVELRLRRVSAPVAEWLTMLPAMTHRCVIESAYVTHGCRRCAYEGESLRSTADAAPPGACPECGGELRATRRWAAPMRLRRGA